MKQMKAGYEDAQKAVKKGKIAGNIDDVIKEMRESLYFKHN